MIFINLQFIGETRLRRLHEECGASKRVKFLGRRMFSTRVYSSITNDLDPITDDALPREFSGVCN